MQVEWGIPDPPDPHMNRWVDLMARHGGVPIVMYDKIFFQWLRNQLLMVEYYAYVGMDFHGDLDLDILEGSQWGDIGKKEIFVYIMFLIF
jgi:hypothetical protein